MGSAFHICAKETLGLPTAALTISLLETLSFIIIVKSDLEFR